MTRYKVLFFLYFFIFVSIGFFFSPFLQQKGLSQVEVGYLTNLGLSLIIILFFTFGYITDKYFSNKLIIIINCIISIFIFLILIFSYNPILLSLSYILSYGCFMVLAPSFDGLVLNNVDSNFYNKIRLWGSIGAGISYLFNTFFLTTIGFTNIIFIDIAFLLLIIILIFISTDKNLNNYKINFKEGMSNLINNKKLIFIFILAFLTYGTLKADDPYSVQYNYNIVSLSAFTVAIVGSVAIFFEAFVMYINTFLKKFKTSTLLFTASFTLFIIYFVRFAFFDIKILIILGNIFIGLFIGLFVPIIIKMISDTSKGELKNTMLGLYQIGTYLGGVIIGVITTLFLDHNGFLPNIYFLHTLIILLSFILIYIYKKEID